MPSRLFPALQMRIVEMFEEEGLTAEEVVVLMSGTAIGRLKAMPREEAAPLALQVIDRLNQHVLNRTEEG